MFLLLVDFILYSVLCGFLSYYVFLSYTICILSITSYLYSDGRWKEAETLHVQVTNFQKTALGEEYPDTLTSINNLAVIFERQGKYEAAELLNKETLRLRKKVHGKEHPDTLISMNNLAGLFDSQGKYEAAEPLYKETL